MKRDGTTGIIYKVASAISNYFIVNLLWVLFNIPIAYLLILLLLTPSSSNQILIITSILLILTPFFFFPATSALFGVVRKWILKDKDLEIVPSYWKYYKENYMKSMLGGMIFTTLWFMCIVNYYFIGTSKGPLFNLIFIPIFVLLFVFTLYFFCSVVHFEGKLLNILRNAILFTIGRPFITIGLAGLAFVLLYISLNHFLFLAPTFMGSLITYFSFSSFLKIFLKLQPPEEIEGDMAS